MSIQINKTVSLNKLWLGILSVYIAASYFAQDVILPSMVNSLTLYAFLGFSAFMIFLKSRIKITPIIIWQLVFLAFSLLAMVYSPSFSLLNGTYYYLIVNFILIFTLSQMELNARQLDTVFSIYLFSSAGLVICLALTGNLNDTSESGRLGQELFGNANVLANMLMVSVIYGFWLLVSRKGFVKRLLYTAAIITVYIGMFLSGGRKYVIVPVIFLYILLLNKRDAKGKKHMLRNTVIILIVFFVLYQIIMNVPMFYDSIGHRFEDAFSLVSDDYQADGSTLKRTEMIEAGFERWLKNPLLGYGFDSFKYYNESSVTGHFYYSHNNFVELLYNQGIIGFLVYYAFYLYLIYKAVKSNLDSLHKGFVIGVIVSTMFFEYFGITYSATPNQFLLFFAYGIIMNDTKATDK